MRCKAFLGVLFVRDSFYSSVEINTKASVALMSLE